MTSKVQILGQWSSWHGSCLWRHGVPILGREAHLLVWCTLNPWVGCTLNPQYTNQKLNETNTPEVEWNEVEWNELNLDMTVLIHQNIRWFEIRDFFYHPLIWSYISCLVLGPAPQKGPQLAQLGTRWELWALERYLCNEQRFLDFHLDTGVCYSSCRMVGFCEVTPNFQEDFA